MESKRQQQVARLIQKDLGEIFQQDAKHLFNKAFITVTSVKVSPDLGIARIYLSFLLEKNPADLLETIQEQTKSIRQLLANRIRNQVRIIPELSFFLDDSFEQAARIEELLSKLDIPPPTQEDKP